MSTSFIIGVSGKGWGDGVQDDVDWGEVALVGEGKKGLVDGG